MLNRLNHKPKPLMISASTVAVSPPRSILPALIFARSRRAIRPTARQKGIPRIPIGMGGKMEIKPINRQATPSHFIRVPRCVSYGTHELTAGVGVAASADRLDL